MIGPVTFGPRVIAPVTFAPLLIVAVFATSPQVHAETPTRLDGSARLRALYSADDGGGPQIAFGFFDADLRARDVTDSGLSLQLDSTLVLDATGENERRFGATESFAQVRQLYAGHPLLDRQLELKLGRQVLREAGNAWVDGLTAKVDLGRVHVGIYGGLSPDPLDYKPDTDTIATGALVELQHEGLDASAAYNLLLRGDAVDRQFLFNRVHYRLSSALYVSSFLVFDLGREDEVSMWLGSVDYTPVSGFNLGLNLSRYSLAQYRDPAIYRSQLEPNQALILGDEIVDLVYDRARFSASFRFWERYYQYQSVEVKHRSQDNREAVGYTIGLRNEDVADSGLELDASARLHNGFMTDTLSLSLDAQLDVSPNLSLTTRATWFSGRTIGRATDRGRLFDESQEIYLLGLGAYYQPLRHHRLDLDYDGAFETELQDQRNQDDLFIHTIMGRYGYWF